MSLQPLFGACAVTFHAEKGHELEHYVGHALTAETRDAIAIHSIPESSGHSLGPSTEGIQDTTYFFRVALGGFDDDLLPSLFGFVFCRQRTSELMKRGREQTSVVLLSPYPLLSLFTAVVQQVGIMYHSRGGGAPVLDQVFWDAQDWQFQWGQFSRVALGPGPPVLMSVPPLEAVPTFPEVCLWSALREVLGSLWALWELVLLGQPLLLWAPDPGASSQAVAALLSLLGPLEYPFPYLPWVTVYRSRAFEELNTSGAQLGAARGLVAWPPAVPRIVGCTNPHTFKALPGWPHRLMCSVPPELKPSPGSQPSRVARLLLRRGGAAGAGLTSAYTPLSRPDTALLSRLLPVPAAAKANTPLLRRHFAGLTAAVLRPLQEALLASAGGPEPLAGFSHEEFMASLAVAPPLLACFGSADRARAFYRRFLASPTFLTWLELERRHSGPPSP